MMEHASMDHTIRMMNKENKQNMVHMTLAFFVDIPGTCAPLENMAFMCTHFLANACNHQNIS